jgi:hypothetical protein
MPIETERQVYEDYLWEVDATEREQEAYERAYLAQRLRELALWQRRLNSGTTAHPPAPS